MQPKDLKGFETDWADLIERYQMEEYYLVLLVKDKESNQVHTVTVATVSPSTEESAMRRVNLLVRGVLAGIYDLVNRYSGFSRHAISGLIQGLALEFVNNQNTDKRSHTKIATINEQAD